MVKNVKPGDMLAQPNSRGQILAITDAEGAQLMTVPFDLNEQRSIRESMPLMQHRKLMSF